MDFECQVYLALCIPANPQSTKIWRRLDNVRPKISEGFQRSPKISRQLPAIAEDFQTTSEDNRGCRRIFDDFKTGLTNCFPPKKIEFLFNQFLSNYAHYCQLGVGNLAECVRSIKAVFE